MFAESTAEYKPINAGLFIYVEDKMLLEIHGE
jgi:hypothetical protein